MSNAEIERRINNAKRIYETVTKYPENFNMRYWFYTEGEEDYYIKPADEVTNCGTTLCIAGWAAHFAGYTLTNGAYAKRDDVVDLMFISHAAKGELYGDKDSLGDLFELDHDEALHALKRMSEGEECNEEFIQEYTSGY